MPLSPTTWSKAAKLSSHFLGILTSSTAAVVRSTSKPWTVLCPALSADGQDTYCVLLVYKGKAVGAYLLEQPSGEVNGLITAAQTMAQAEADAAETAADAAPPEEDTEVSADAGTEDTEVSVDLSDAGPWPVE